MSHKAHFSKSQKKPTYFHSFFTPMKIRFSTRAHILDLQHCLSCIFLNLLVSASLLYPKLEETEMELQMAIRQRQMQKIKCWITTEKAHL